MKPVLIMSRIGKHPVTVPSGVEVSIEGQTVKVKGKLGSLQETLPGEVVGSNADQVNDAGELTWTFDGKWVLDRDMELLASSRVPHEDQ